MGPPGVPSHFGGPRGNGPRFDSGHGGPGHIGHGEHDDHSDRDDHSDHVGHDHAAGDHLAHDHVGGRGNHGGYGGPGHGHHGRRDGSLGRAARFRMLDALEAAERDGRTLTISMIGEAIGVDQPRASRLVQEASDAGLVRRSPDPADARRSIVQLTEAGRKQISEVRTIRRSAVEDALASFTADEARTFALLFDRFVKAWPRE